MKTKKIISIYLSGFLAGLVLVLYPAAGNLFTDENFHGFSSSQFGNIFIPQIFIAIIASFGASKLADKITMKGVLLLGLLLLIVSTCFMSASNFFMAGDLDFYLIMAGTASLGAGFGFTITALNPFSYNLFPGKETSAVTAMHIMLGLGTASASLVLDAFVKINYWYGAPIVTAIVLVLLLLFTLTVKLELPSDESTSSSKSNKIPRRIWLFGIVVFFYAAGEATFGNWGSVFLEKQGGLSKSAAALGLSLFWGFVALGRLLFTLVALKFSTKWLYIIVPFILAITFFIIPQINTKPLLLLLMSTAGTAMSFIFPKTISEATDQYPAHASFISGLSVGALQLGSGLSSNIIGSLNGKFSLGHLFQFSTLYALIFGVLIIYLTLMPKAEKL